MSVKTLPLTLPKGFWKMPPEEMARQYPLKKQMPQEAYYSEDGKAILSINHRPDRFKIRQIQQFKEKVFDQSVSRAHPEYESKIIVINDVPFILMRYRIDLEEPLFMTTLVSSHQKRMLMIAFSCPLEDKQAWEPIIQQTFQTLQVDPQ